MKKQILVMNFGSTSTKLAIYEDKNEISRESIQHDEDKIRKFSNVFEQKDFRLQEVLGFLSRKAFDLKSFDCIITRGGHWKPVPGGIFVINEEMLKDLRTGKWGVHPADVGVEIAYQLGKDYHIPAISADTAITDEFCDFARFSGIKELARISSFHVLNHKAIARRHAAAIGKKYEELRLIVCHFGGGFSIAAHRCGRMIDANNALDGDGPFSPERAGTVPAGDLVKMCFSGKYTQSEITKMLTGRGGLVSYLGTSNALDVERRIENGDEYAKTVYSAMAYQAAKEIGSAACVLSGRVDAILMTGSISYSEKFTSMVSQYVEWIAPVYKYPGEDEMLSMAENAYRYLYHEQEPLKYSEVTLVRD